jgi:HAD superfamily hydrolase (TIGR01509 family)
MKHWVFDLDGTLVESFSHYFLSLQAIYEELGSRFLDEHRADAHAQMPAQFLVRHLGEKAGAEALSRLYSRSNDDARRVQPFEGVRAVVERLAARDARIAVWTARELESATLVLRHTGLDRFVEACVSGSCVTRPKPHPEGLLKIIERFGCAPSEVTVVGDHLNDVLGAKAAGARAVRASWHVYGHVDDCSHSDHQFRHIADFSAWIDAP